MINVNWQRILAATDFSPCGNEAVKAAHALAEKLGAELHVLHVTADSYAYSAEFAITGVLEPQDGEGETKAWLAALLGETGGVRRVETLRLDQDVAHGINDYARKRHIDLIVMATHGRTGLARFWLGSKTEEVMRSAPCPVLVIRPEREALGGGHASPAGDLELTKKEDNHVRGD
jgi:nucleotide-binding universal stress UspA family protein